jgi:hypothetical protein
MPLRATAALSRARRLSEVEVVKTYSIILEFFPTLTRCDKPIGAMAVVEPQNERTQDGGNSDSLTTPT